MTNLRSVVIGCGLIGSRFSDDPKAKGIQSHAGAYDKCTGTSLVAVCDANQDALSQCAHRWNVARAYSDVAELLLKEKPDLVSICTPDSTHAQILRTVVNSESVRGVIVEKPLALDVGEAERLVSLANKRNIVVCVNYSRRYSPGHKRVKHAIQNGEIGEIQTVSGYYTKGVLHNGTHWFDLARFLLGEIDVVQGFFRGNDIAPDPTLDVRMVFTSGARGNLLGCDAQSFTIFEMDILGTTGRIRLSESGHQIQQFDVVDSPFYSGYRVTREKERWEGDFNDALLNAIQNLVDCVTRGVLPICSGSDGIAAVRIGAAAIESAKNNSPLTLLPQAKVCE